MDVSAYIDVRLIKEVKKHKELYVKDCWQYRNRQIRNDAWEAISEVVDSPVSLCKARWHSLRDRYIKEFTNIHQMCSDADEMFESSWEYYPYMDFLRDYVSLRQKRGLPRSRKRSIKYEIEDSIKNETITEEVTPLKGYFNPDPLIEQSDSAIEYTSVSTWTEEQSSETPTSSQRDQQRQSCSHSDEFSKFLSKFDTPAKPREHEGFFRMVQEFFKKLPLSEVDDAKVFYINFLHEQIKNKRI